MMDTASAGVTRRENRLGQVGRGRVRDGMVLFTGPSVFQKNTAALQVHCSGGQKKKCERMHFVVK
jgi:hypothetical protein